MTGPSRSHCLTVARVAAARSVRTMVGVMLAVAAACAHDSLDASAPGAITLELPNGGRVDTLAVGEQVQLSLTWGSGDGRDRPVTWSTSPVTVATVSSTGTVTAVAPGGATVSATSGSAADTVWIVVVPSRSAGPLAVFPGAVGFGATTPAGRRGAVVHVTTLDDAGPGSLRAALQATGARTVVFDVGGTITLSTRLIVRQPFLTVAGQTAPPPGITLRGAGLSIRTHDVLVQHVRVRVGDGPGDDPTDRDAIEILGPNGYDIVIDHVSLSWAMDENFSTWSDGVHDVTLSNAIVSEALNAVEPAQGLLVGDQTKRFAVVGTLMAHNSQRNPYFKGGTTGIAANNVVYNWSGSVATYYGDPEGSGPTQAAWVGNVGIRGPDANTAAMMRVYSNAKPGTLIYVADNSDIRVNGGLAPANPWSLVQNDASSSVMASSPPVWPDGFTAMPNGEVYESVLANAGAWPANRDAVDQRVVADVRNRTGRIIASQNQVGGWPNLGTPRRAPALPANPNGDDDGDGYTNLEEWLHSLARAVEGR